MQFQLLFLNWVDDLKKKIVVCLIISKDSGLSYRGYYYNMNILFFILMFTYLSKNVLLNNTSNQVGFDLSQT